MTKRSDRVVDGAVSAGQKLPAVEDHFGWLAAFLSPFKSDASLNELSAAIGNGDMQWGPILRQANLHFCTPLWFGSLQRDGIIHLIPDELQDYLSLMHQANTERNEQFRQVLEAILIEFERYGISNVLLKGAATFCDHLYPAPGDRMMGDLDILVEPRLAGEAWALLRDLGFREETRVTRSSRSRFRGNGLHHLPRVNLPGTPVDVELHTSVGGLQSDRVLPVEEAWRHTLPVRLGNARTLILEPTYRLIHNTTHALVPHQEFIGSNVALRQLTEFAFLAKRYNTSVVWGQWHAAGSKERLGFEFLCYLQLTQHLMGMRMPPDIAWSRRASLHVWRIRVAARHGKNAELPSSLQGWIRALFYSLYGRSL